MITTLLENSRYGLCLPQQRHIVPEGSERPRRQLAKYELRSRIARAVAFMAVWAVAEWRNSDVELLGQPWRRAVEPVSGEPVVGRDVVRLMRSRE